MAPEREHQDDRPAKIAAALATLGILLVMGGVRTCMEYAGTNTISSKAEHPPAATHPGAGRYCEVSSRPRGARLTAVHDTGVEALGVTPTEVEQGHHAIRIELEGYKPVETVIGVVEGGCTRHFDLVPVETR